MTSIVNENYQLEDIILMYIHIERKYVWKLVVRVNILILEVKEIRNLLVCSFRVTSIADHLNVGFALIHKEVNLSKFALQRFRTLMYLDSILVRISDFFFTVKYCQGLTILWAYESKPRLILSFLQTHFEVKIQDFLLEL